MKAETIYEVVKKLVGHIEPIGETRTDERRLENLTKTIILVDKLVFDIGLVADGNKNRIECSMKKSGKLAHKFLHDLKMSLDE